MSIIIFQKCMQDMDRLVSMHYPNKDEVRKKRDHVSILLEKHPDPLSDPLPHVSFLYNRMVIILHGITSQNTLIKNKNIFTHFFDRLIDPNIEILQLSIIANALTFYKSEAYMDRMTKLFSLLSVYESSGNNIDEKLSFDKFMEFINNINTFYERIGNMEIIIECMKNLQIISPSSFLCNFYNAFFFIEQELRREESGSPFQDIIPHLFQDDHLL